MRGPTHVLLGVGSAAIGLWVIGDAVHLGTAQFMACLAGSAVGSVLPDIDHPRSTASRAVPRALASRGGGILLATATLLSIAARWAPHWISRPAHAVLDAAASLGMGLVVIAVALVVLSLSVRLVTKHRGATHSLLAVGVVLGVGWWIASLFGMSAWPFVAVAWGWLTHLAADAVSRGGMTRLWWPFA